MPPRRRAEPSPFGTGPFQKQLGNSLRIFVNIYGEGSIVAITFKLFSNVRNHLFFSEMYHLFASSDYFSIEILVLLLFFFLLISMSCLY